MTSWLIDTLIWTGALIALVLVLRRPVARWFGAQLAYLLWLLPLTRLLLPPLTLPAWLAPAPEALPAQTQAAESAGVPAPITDAPPAFEAAAAPFATSPVTAAPIASDPVPWMAILLTLWLVGAAVFIALRFNAYFRMRRMVLKQAIPVGEAECGRARIRMVESAAISSPLAFGVIDRVVALPEGFMGAQDRTARDLALEHELAHHRGGDLLMNFAVQPLFALHWFNPLAFAGWRAMRRDQEAACDARVVANRDAEIRAVYGQVIAGFATKPELSRTAMLAAPMACPVLGDKSIIQRLRSLTMSDISPRRRFAGRTAIVGAALALPLTASITYAEVIAPPPAPAAPLSLAEVPAPPAPPSGRAPFAPQAPMAPEAPEPPAPGETERNVRFIVLGDDDDTSVDIRRFETLTEALNDPELQERFAELETDVARITREIDTRFSEEQMEGLEEAIENASEAASLAAERQIVTSIGCDTFTVRVRPGEGQETVTRSDDNCFIDAQQIALSAITQARDAIAADRDIGERERREALEGLERALAELRKTGVS